MDLSQSPSRVDVYRHRVDTAIAAYREVAQILGDTEELASLRDELFASLLVALDAAFAERPPADSGPSAEVRRLATAVHAGEQPLIDDDRLEELAAAYFASLTSA